MYKNTDSYWILAYTNFWYNMVGKDHFVLYNAAFRRVGVFYLKKNNKQQTTSIFYFSAYFDGKYGLYCTKENLKGKVNLTGSLRCLCCFLTSWLDALIFLTNWKWALYIHCFSTGYTAFT